MVANRKVIAFIVALILIICLAYRFIMAYSKGIENLIDNIINVGIALSIPILFFLISKERVFHSKKKLKITSGKKCVEMEGQDVDRIKISDDTIDVKAKKGGNK